MYFEHFGLSAPPFRITPDTRLFFDGGNRGAILDAMVYAITSGEGITKVVGEVGSGKTMLCRMLEVKLPDNVEVVYLANPSISPEDILEAIAFEMKLDIDVKAGQLQIMHALQEHLLARHARNELVVVFIEEAQSMPMETLEEIRLLSNLETQENKLLQIVLFGQPELDQNLAASNIRQLKERITHSFNLEDLQEKEILQYVNFRMRLAGYKGPDVFNSASARRIAGYSKGLIRRINILADKALLSAFSAGEHTITSKHVDIAAQDSEFGKPLMGNTFVYTAVALVLLAVIAGVFWKLIDMGNPVFNQSENNRQALIENEVVIDEDEMPLKEGPVKKSAVKKAETSTENRTNKEISRIPVAENNPVSKDIVREIEVESKNILTQSFASFENEEKEPEPGIDTLAETDTGLPAKAISSLPVEGIPVNVEENENIAVQPPSQLDVPAQLEKPMQAAKIEDKEMIQVAGNRIQAVETKAIQSKQTKDGALTGEAFLKNRLNETYQWLAAVERHHYSIQLFMISKSRGKFLAENLKYTGLDKDSDKVYVYEADIVDKDLLGVLLNDYTTYADASEALSTLPDSFRSGRPFIRKVEDIKYRID